MNKSKMIVRTKFIDRACHWTVVICFFLVALSGISFFFPTLQWLTETFGTPQMGRILHPFFGVAIFIALMFMFVRFVHHNIPDKQDIPWLKGIVEVLKGNEHKVARVGKYNAGQKMMFWTIMSMIFVLLVTGVIIWRPWFAPFFPIQVIRYSLLIHATSAIILIHAILIHMYMAFWVKGSIKGMVEGKVSRRWAKKHHPRWYREVERLEAKKREFRRHLVPPFLTVSWRDLVAPCAFSSRYAGLPAQRAAVREFQRIAIRVAEKNVIAHRFPKLLRLLSQHTLPPRHRGFPVDLRFGRAGDT